MFEANSRYHHIPPQTRSFQQIYNPVLDTSMLCYTAFRATDTRNGMTVCQQTVLRLLCARWQSALSLNKLVEQAYPNKRHFPDVIER